MGDLLPRLLYGYTTTLEFLHECVFSSNFLHEPNSSQEVNQIMSISQALDLARDTGVDVILINEARAAWDEERVCFSWHQARHPVKFNMNFRILPLSVSTTKDQDPPLVKIASARAQSLPL